MEKVKVLVIVGPTASGKSELAAYLARRLGAEVIGADSMQVYRHMDIGTAKPARALRALVAHHMLDMVCPDEGYTAVRYMEEASAKIMEVRSRGRLALVAGGTGLYIKALTMGIFRGPGADARLREGLLAEARASGPCPLHERLKEVDPASAAWIHPNNLQRVIRALEVYEATGRPISEFQREHAFSGGPFDTLKIGLAKDRAALYRDIDERAEAMLRDGLIEETEGLLGMGYSEGLKPMRGLGYREMVMHIKGGLTKDEAVRLLKMNTRRYAKRQMTWFRKDAEVRWFSPSDRERISGLAEGFLC
jgi:tRNA dimethylallyltransferase